jgi:hypothetical protein
MSRPVQSYNTSGALTSLLRVKRYTSSHDQARSARASLTTCRTRVLSKLKACECYRDDRQQDSQPSRNRARKCDQERAGGISRSICQLFRYLRYVAVTVTVVQSLASGTDRL